MGVTVALALADSLQPTLAGVAGGLLVAVVGATVVGVARLVVGTDKRTAVDTAAFEARFAEHVKRDDERASRVDAAVGRIETGIADLRDSVARLETKVDERTDRREPTGQHSAVQIARKL